MKLLREFSLMLIFSAFSLYGQESENTIKTKVEFESIKNTFLIIFDSEKTTLYEDGAERIKYPSYSIYSSENKLIARIPSALDTPYKVEIETGNYIIEYTNINGENKRLKVKTSLNEISKLVK